MKSWQALLIILGTLAAVTAAAVGTLNAILSILADKLL